MPLVQGADSGEI